jgi:hypothetical protein
METRIVQAFIGLTQKLFFAYTNQDFISASQTDQGFVAGGQGCGLRLRGSE